MPPEQLPWDRRDFRKHERSGSDPRFGGGGFGGGWTHRWREQQHHPHAPPSFQHHNNHQPQQPWYSDFRTSRPIPPGHGKQCGWHMYPDEAGHVFLPFGSRYNDRDVADDNIRPFGSCGEAKYFRNNRESRGSFSQKDWRSHSWEPVVSSSGPGRPTPEVTNQKAAENTQTCHKVNNQKAMDNIQTCHRVTNQKAVENTQTCHKVNNQKAMDNTQTCHKVNNLKAMENTRTCHKLNNLKTMENTQTSHKVNDQKAVQDTQTCHKVQNQKAMENTQAFHKENNEKAMEITQTCHKVNNQKAVEKAQTFHKNNSVNKDYTHPLSDSLSCPLQSLLEEKQEKNGVAVAGTLSSSGPNADKENGLGSIDWKPVKWSRSGSLVSRSSGFGHSSSSKSLGVDSTEIMVDVHQKDVTPVQSPAAASITPSARDSSDETCSRKKPRLGWGEGLAKFEKKRVDGYEDDVAKDRLVVGVTSTETIQSPSLNLVDKSPRFGNFPDCASPATPASVACSSSPGVTGFEEKESIKAANVDHNTANLSSLPGIDSQIYREGPAFNLENLEPASVAKLSSLINELLHSNDPSSAEAGCAQITSMNKLLVCKVNILKALEVTESGIDSLETKLKLLTAESNGCHPYPVAYSPQSEECLLEPSEKPAASSGYTVLPAPLQIASSGNMIDEVIPAALEKESMDVKDEEIDSPGTATSKLVEAVSSGEDTCTSKNTQCVEGFARLDLDNSSNLNQSFSEDGLSDEDNMCPVDVPNPIMRNFQNLDSVGNVQFDHIYDSVLVSNKESATRAVEELNKLLPDEQSMFDISTVSRVSSFQRDSLVTTEKFRARKWSLKFKEKVIALKFKVFHHFWKKGRVVSLRKLRGKFHKMFDLSRTGYRKNRSSIHSRISYFAGSRQIVPAEEVIEFINGLLSAPPFKPCRNSLKMPSFILDKEIRMSRFISNNGMVGDPCAAEKEISIINPWTAEEREIFIDKLAIFGKNFSKIAPFLEHKTIADCIEFYYKNHKSECFERARKKPDSAEQSKSQATAYLVATGKRSNRAVNAVNLDILGDASIIAAALSDGLGTQQPKIRSRILLGATTSHKIPAGDDDPLKISSSLDMYSNETAAADVLAGICGSLSSEAMSSCITSSFDPVDRCQDLKGPQASSSIKQPLTPDVTLNVDDECSDESCAEIDTTDWADEEKSIFIQAMSSYGKDFVRISQCIGTKTGEQCKIFFSKARKCLGLDQIHPGAGNNDFGDFNGGGSDIEDGCVVQNSSVTCSDDSENKIEENLTPCKMKMDQTSDTAESHKLKADVNVYGKGSRTCPCDSLSAGTVSKNSISVSDSKVDNKPAVDFNAGSRKHNGANASVLEVTPQYVSFKSKSLQVEPGVDGSVEPDNKALVEVSDGDVWAENPWQGHTLPDRNLENEKVEHRDVNLADAASDHQLSGNVSHPSVDAHSSMQVESEPRKEAGFESCSAEKSHLILSQQNGHIASVESSTLFSVPIKYQSHSIGDGFPNVRTNGVNNKYLIVRTGDFQQQQLSGNSLEPIESSQILKGYPVQVHTMKDVNLDVNCKKPVLPHNVHSRDLDRHTDFSLQRCTSSGHQSEESMAPRQSQEQNCSDKSIPQSGCSSDSDKPSRNGDVKLFGKILVSSQQEPNSRVLDACPDNMQHNKTGGQSLNLRLGVDDKVNLPCSKLKFDWNNYTGTENIPARSFRIWDANKTPTGFPLLDSTLLLAKYPAAFSNHSITAEQPPLCRVSNPSNSVSVIPRELSSNIEPIKFHMLRNREFQPLTKDARELPQDILLAEMQRRNGIEVMAAMQQQQQARKMVAINNVAGRGVGLQGGQCPGASNQVTAVAVKMQYGKAQNFNDGDGR